MKSKVKHGYKAFLYRPGGMVETPVTPRVNDLVSRCEICKKQGLISAYTISYIEVRETVLNDAEVAYYVDQVNAN